MGEVVTPKACDPKSDESLDALISHATDYAGWTERDARYLIDKIDRIKEAGTWPKRLRRGPKTWERFCSQVLTYDADYFDRIRDGIKVLEEKGITHPSLAQAQEAGIRCHGGDRRSDSFKAEKEDFRGTISTLKRGTTSEYLVARLRRDHPGVYERLRAGEFNSIRAAIREAGIPIRETVQIPKDPDGAARLILKHFKKKQVDELIRLLTEARS